MTYSSPRRYGKTIRWSRLAAVELNIFETIKELDGTYNVDKQIRLSKKLTRLYEIKKSILES